MNKFTFDGHRYWIWALIAVVLLTTCSACGGKLNDKELIEAVGDAGCNLKSIKRAGGEIEKIDCHETVRVLHER